LLVLTSYNPVNWLIRIEGGAQLRAVILSGNEESTVFGAGSARIHQLGRWNAYRRGTLEFKALEGEIRKTTGKFDS
jgi:hypothetical protein